MFLTVLIESHAELSLCMQMHTELSSISRGGGVSVEGRVGVLVHELSDRFFLNVLTAMLSATAVFGAIIQYTCIILSHTVICQPINYNCHLRTISDS